MVQTRHQKSKPKKQPTVRKKGKEGDMTDFRGQLDALGLKIIEVTADGNCFFRALADQLEGDEEEHQKYRDMVVKYIEKNREMFEPFIEDEVPFDNYCCLMEKDGTWAGHMELQASSLVTHRNICIHRSMSPRWYIRNFNDSEAHMVHLSYHDGEHYNSVRLKEDSCAGPARPILIKADAGLSATSHHKKVTPSKSREGYGCNIANEGSIKLVMAGTGCSNEEKVKQVLFQVDGDTDAAIEFLIADQGADELQSEDDVSLKVFDVADNHDSCQVEVRQVSSRSIRESDDKISDCMLADKCDSGVAKEFSSTVAKSCDDKKFEYVSVDNHDNSIDKKESLGTSGLGGNDDKSEQECKKVPRNKACPCGSKKKYKSCCGTSTGKTMQFPVTKTSSNRKDKKQGKNSGTSKVPTTNSPLGGPPDVGALCI
uniref:OTU domain-containing protein n=1 Tax=Kalanchoe fedtschenkoi TaxID=63787 RepID=A0A7N0ZZU6_KALFE